MTRALLIIDIQNDYFPGGNKPLVNPEAAGERAHALLEAFRQRGELVVHIRHLSVRKGASFFLPDTPGAEIHPCVQPIEGEPVFVKYYPNSFRDTGLDELLQEHKVRKLVVCGMMSNMCVDATVRAAFDLKYFCTVAADACAAPDLEFNGTLVPAAHVHAAFMAALASVYAQVKPVEEILDTVD